MMKIAVTSCLAFLLTPAYAEVAPQPTRLHQVYDIVRQGDKIGTNVVDIEKQGDTTHVKTATAIRVKIMFVEAYRYEHSAHETWKGAQLVAFKSQTDDNGTKHNVAMTSATEGAKLEVDGKASTAPKNVAPASLWSRDLGLRPELFDPANGKRLAVRVSDLGDETIDFNGAPRKLHHYKMAGDFPRDLWFEGDTLVRMKLVGSDNSTIVSDLRQTTAAR